MKTLTLLAALLCSATALAQSPTTTPPEEPKCVAVVFHAQAVLVSQLGGGAGVETKMIPAHLAPATRAVTAMYAYGAGKTDCLKLTKLEALSLAEAGGILGEYIEKAGAMPKLLEALVTEWGAPAAKTHVHAYAKFATTLMAFIRS